MRVLRVGSLAIALLLTAGCAGPISRPETASGLAPCLPPAISAQFFFWPVVGFRSINLLTEDGDFVPASWVLYRRGKISVSTMWAQSELIAVDPSPDSDAAEWVDLSLVTPVDGKLVLRRQPEAPCRWGRWEGESSASLR